MTVKELIELCENEGGFMILVLPRNQMPKGQNIRMAESGSPIGFFQSIRDDMAGAKYHVVARFKCQDVAKWILKTSTLSDKERERLEKVVT